GIRRPDRDREPPAPAAGGSRHGRGVGPWTAAGGPDRGTGGVRAALEIVDPPYDDVPLPRFRARYTTPTAAIRDLLPAAAPGHRSLAVRVGRHRARAERRRLRGRDPARRHPGAGAGAR